ncbi:MAG: hypothetical protein IPL42_13965 [Saprospiraceae bacterium]|nr:hypothetical protein [Saprospiraceae bacterium]
MYTMNGIRFTSGVSTRLKAAEAIEVIERAPKMCDTSAPTCHLDKFTKTIFFSSIALR